MLVHCTGCTGWTLSVGVVVVERRRRTVNDHCETIEVGETSVGFWIGDGKSELKIALPEFWIRSAKSVKSNVLISWNTTVSSLKRYSASASTAAIAAWCERETSGKRRVLKFDTFWRIQNPRAVGDFTRHEEVQRSVKRQQFEDWCCVVVCLLHRDV